MNQSNPSSSVGRARRREALESPIGRVGANRRVRHGGQSWVHPRVFGSFAVVYVIQGQGRYEDALGASRRVGPGDLIVVFPDLAHRYGPEDWWEEHYIVFSGPVFDAWSASGLLDRRRPVMHLEPVEHWSRRLGWVTGESAGPARTRALGEVCRMQQVLMEMLSSAAGGTGGVGEVGEEGWIIQAQEMLSDPANAAAPLQRIADELGLAYPTLRRRFRELVGKSPGQFRSARMIELACARMAQTRMSDKQIAGELGFCDVFYFSRRFKQMMGRTPGDFRKGLRWGGKKN